ncbi:MULTISPECIES: RNA ligase RtcB family protein [unclassified Pseudovibrio]|uniref:RNA ligase RtcB family protein n=1 Tax=unclassified Pseudovibrio TaxID=2627060 RepID=UPI0007B1AD6E|nr:MULTISPECIES: RNA ligase RtcB family protein [unclassified Pseudovibrio]KZL03804.1 RNA-splicing ligase RtcB [Pseudovibrio sp. W74]KZL09801.1 RNA-splicing ligase RtcB [Pseudovibrio sp. Ad14]
MGNLRLDCATRAACAPAPIHKFYGTSAWILGDAEVQLNKLAELEAVKQIAAFPDLHPGPVGVAILSDRVHPHMIGNDIGCGMTVFRTSLSAHKLKPQKLADRLRMLQDYSDLKEGQAHLRSAGLPEDLAPNAIGTIGGGNHFCEVQVLAETPDPDLASRAGISKGDVLLFVHSGSRSLGASIFEEYAALGPEGMPAGDERTHAYLMWHDLAVRWASLNRKVIAERAAAALRCDVELVVDSSHNLIERYGDAFLHRKGAAKADVDLVPLAGSRDAKSFLLKPTGNNPEALSSLAHGAGRKYDRASMHGRIAKQKSVRNALVRTSYGGRVVCEDKQLLVEEAPQAYKNSEDVLNQLVEAELATCVGVMTPVVTFKTARGADERRGKR